MNPLNLNRKRHSKVRDCVLAIFALLYCLAIICYSISTAGDLLPVCTVGARSLPARGESAEVLKSCVRKIQQLGISVDRSDYIRLIFLVAFLSAAQAVGLLICLKHARSDRDRRIDRVLLPLSLAAVPVSSIYFIYSSHYHDSICRAVTSVVDEASAEFNLATTQCEQLFRSMPWYSPTDPNRYDLIAGILALEVVLVCINWRLGLLSRRLA